MKKTSVSLALFGALLAFGSQLANAAAPDWNKVPKRTIQVFHAGVTPAEWVMKKSDHSGRTGINKGESCVGCHEEKGGLNFDMKRLAGKELEPKGAPKTMSFPVTVQSAYDKDHAYIRLTFKAPAGGFDPADKENDVKVAMMFANDEVSKGAQIGCWGTCHGDARTMPGADDKKTKYTKGGAYELMQWKSAAGAKAVDGSVTDKRNMEGGTAGVVAEGSKSGDTYTVTFTRKLSGTLAEGKATPFGVAVHADHATGRFHHVSMGYTMGFGVDADVKSAKQ
ncbi:ethylbenzene dehydrogenase-related protein [Accumulibacter sp.]|uniref:ethylbenzene dehydrogenase-related protein n=1 Tax=Accumulibacter sp. TaxID=2053492 RepID=UPI002629EBAB|nr:ethylbenzene dehydrogenase-related protein [Accumulibacter sp.]HRD93435.1 ethylbenzene dehydrogenase-related protein [Accumulibacter sp.]